MTNKTMFTELDELEEQRGKFNYIHGDNIWIAVKVAPHPW